MKGTQAVAQRIVNAEENFIALVQQVTGCSREQGTKALATMRSLKVLKLDAVNGVYNVKHGAFLEASALWNAINY